MANQQMRVQLQPRSSGFNFEENRRKIEEQKAKAREAQTEFPTERPPEVKKSLQEKILSFTGGNILGRGLGLGLAQGGTKQVTDQIQTGEGEMQQRLVEAIKKNQAEGKDTSRLVNALKQLTGGIENTGNTANDLYTEGITSKQVIGDAAQLAATAATGLKPASAGYQTGSLAVKGATSAKAANLLGKAGIASNVIPKVASPAVPGILQGALQGAKTGAMTGLKTGLPFGAATGVSQGLKENKSVADSLKQGAVGAVVGGATGGILGGTIGAVTGGVSGGLEKYASRSKLVSSQVQEGTRPTLSRVVTEKSSTNPKFNQLVKEAQKQGFTEADINFLGTISKKDKPIMQKMFDLTVKAQSDPRQITRAGDVLGENVTNQVKQVMLLNKKAGLAVDTTAKSLRGQSVGVEPLKSRVLSGLDNLGIGIADDGTLDFSQSVFKNTPAIQKEIQKVITSIPDGSDAYQMHIFKKSIDELVDYGVGGEGLKGRSAGFLKNIRNAADDVLDSTFDDYNIANSSYKQTRDYIEAAKALVGKKVDLDSREGSQLFGQALRSAFSNNKSRPNTLKFIEDTHLISKELGLEGAEKNLLDQALFVDMLEQNFGSEATTGLAGEVSKAIKNVNRGIGIIREPISGGLNLVADVIEKARNISPEQKRQILRSFLQ